MLLVSRLCFRRRCRYRCFLDVIGEQQHDRLPRAQCVLDRKVCVVKRGLGSNSAMADVEGVEERRLIEVKGAGAFRVRADDKNKRDTGYASLGQSG